MPTGAAASGVFMIPPGIWAKAEAVKRSEVKRAFMLIERNE